MRRVAGPRISGTSATTIGISRTDDSDTANAAAASELPDRMAPTSTTCAGSAHTAPVMKTDWASVSPASLASPAKPTKALARISPGSEKAPPTPRRNQRRWRAIVRTRSAAGSGIASEARATPQSESGLRPEWRKQ